MTMNSKPATLSDPETSQSGLRVFFRITQAWGLTSEQEQIVLGTNGSTFSDWKAGNVRTALDLVTLERLSYVLRIYAALEVLLPIPERANKWVKAPNTAPLFSGASALERILTGQVGDLKAVADYLDAEQGESFIQPPSPAGNNVEQWNALHDRIGSFANDHTTL
jgi:hypothetical protein